VVVVVDFMLEGSGIYLCWTGDRVLGVCTALCVFRTVAMVERGHFLVHAAGGREQRQQGQEHAQEDRQDNNETTPTSSIFMFMTLSKHATISICLSAFASCRS